MNLVALVGRLTADPEYKKTSSGKTVCTFTVAAKRKYSDKTDFLNCFAWEQTAEFIDRFFSKGKWIAIAGELQTRQYKDYDTGKNITVYEVKVDNAWFAGDRQTTSQPSTEPDGPKVSANDGQFENVNLDQGDLPF